MLTHKQLRTKALANAEVKAEYKKLVEEFYLLGEFLKARAVHDLTHEQVVTKISRVNMKSALLRSEKQASASRRPPKYLNLHRSGVSTGFRRGNLELPFA